jgi:Holliday junction resolvase RusA-like endonuclease
MSEQRTPILGSKELEEDLERSDKGEIPSPWGEMKIEVNVEPISSGSTANTKKKLKRILHDQCKLYQFLLSSDVQIEIVWAVHERYRYEYHKAPDIDNIVKPILDALTGPDGILIDDTQVQYVGCSWIDSTRDDHRLTITLKYSPDLYVQKDDLRFVEFDKGLCFPINTIPKKEALKIILDTVGKMLSANRLLEQNGVDYYTAKGVLPIQRFFHRNKLSKYTIVQKDQIIGGA